MTTTAPPMVTWRLMSVPHILPATDDRRIAPANAYSSGHHLGSPTLNIAYINQFLVANPIMPRCIKAYSVGTLWRTGKKNAILPHSAHETGPRVPPPLARWLTPAAAGRRSGGCQRA